MSAAAHSPSGAAARDASAWEERLVELTTRYRVPGATLGILSDGAITTTGTGVLSKATRVEVTPDSLFQIGSITKVWTATLVMQLVDEGLLDLDAPVAEVLPGFRVADPDVTRSVTTRHLLVHRAAVGHVGEPDEDPVPATSWALSRSMGPAGMVTASVEDVLTFARMHLDGGLAPDGTRVLSPASVEAMAAKEAELPDTYTLGDSWGLGWIRFGWDGERLLGHDGNTIGQSAFLRVLPSQRLAVALLTNGGNTKDLFHDLYREIFGQAAGVEKPAPLEPRASPPDVDPERYAGRYERSGMTTEVLVGDGGGLTLRATTTGPLADVVPEPVHEFPLVAVEPDLFVLRPPGVTTWTAVTFYSLADGSRYVHYGARANPLVAG